MPSSASCGRGSLPSRSVPARDWRLRIEDILAAGERVQRDAAGMDLASFLADEKTVGAVSFCFRVIGERHARILVPVATTESIMRWLGVPTRWTHGGTYILR